MNNYIQASEVAADLQDRIDDLVITEEIPRALADKYASPVRLVKAINEADIDVCGWLKPNTTAVLLLKKGESDLMIRRAKASPYGATYLPNDTVGYSLLNNFVDYSQIRSGKAHLYTEYPIGRVSAFKEVRFVSPSEFDSSGGNSVEALAVVDYYRGRIRFSTSFDVDAFVTFQCQVMPLKTPVEGLGTDPIQGYLVRTPHYATELLVHVALMKLLPKNIRYYSILASELLMLKSRAYENMPVETGVVQIESTFFDEF